jgi:hypothetical protein
MHAAFISKFKAVTTTAASTAATAATASTASTEATTTTKPHHLGVYNKKDIYLCVKNGGEHILYGSQFITIPIWARLRNKNYNLNHAIQIIEWRMLIKNP